MPDLAQPLDRFVGRPERIDDATEVDERRQVADPFGKPGAGDRVSYDRDLKTLLNEVAQVAFDGEAGDHSRENNLVDPLLPKPDADIIDPKLRIDDVRRAYDRFAILDVRLEEGHEG